MNIKATVASLEQIPGFEHEKVRLGDTCYVILPDFKKQPLTFGLGLSEGDHLSLSPASLSLNPDSFTMQVNERVVAFRGDETAVVEDGWLAKGNRNLVPGSHLGELGAIQTGADDSPVETQGMDAPLSLYWDTRLEEF